MPPRPRVHQLSVPNLTRSTSASSAPPGAVHQAGLADEALDITDAKLLD